MMNSQQFLELLAKNNVDITELSTKVSELSGNAVLNGENIDPDDLQCVSQQLSIGKSRIAAGFMAFFLGSFGIHHFYLENAETGLTCLLFCWTGIPTICGLIDSIILFSSPYSRTIWI